MECEVWTKFAIFDLEIRNILGQKQILYIIAFIKNINVKNIKIPYESIHSTVFNHKYKKMASKTWFYYGIMTELF